MALTWSLHPYPALAVALQGLRVRNPDWARGPDLLSAAKVDVQFDLRALLQRTIVVERLVVHDADLHLETGVDGQDNWHFSGGSGDAGILRLSSLRVLESTVAFQSALGPTPYGAWQAAVTRLDLGGLDGGQTVLDADLVYAETPVSLKADAGQADASASLRWPFQIQAQAAGTDFQVRGSSAAPFDPADLDAAVALQGPTPAPLGRLLGIDGLPDGPFQFNFELSRRNQELQLSRLAGFVDNSALPASVTVTGGDAALAADGVWSMALTGSLGTLPATLKLTSAAATAKGDRTAVDGFVAIRATLADNDFDGSLRPASQARRAMLSGKLVLGSIALDKITFGNAGGSAGVASKPATSPTAKLNGQAQPLAWRDKPLPIAALNRLDADLTVSAKALSWQRISVEKPRARVLLRNGRLRLEQITAALPGLTLTGNARVDAGPRPPVVTLALHTDHVDLSRALRMLAKPPTFDGTIDRLKLTLQTHGDTPAALIRGLGGKVAAASVQVRVPVGKGRDRWEVGLGSPSLTIEPGKTVSLSSGVTLATRSFDLTLTGGSLADLLWQVNPWPRIAVSARGKLGDEDVAVKGHVGPLSAVVAGRDVTLDLALSDLPVKRGKARSQPGKRLSASVVGTLVRLDDLDGSRLKVQVSGQSLAALSPLLQVELPAQSFTAAARLEGRPQRLDLLDLKATSGDSDIAGQLRIEFGAQPRVDALLTARRLDLSAFADASGRMADGDAINQAAAKTKASTAGLDPGWMAKVAQTLPLEGLRRFDAELHLGAGHAHLGDFGVDDARLDATLDAGHLVLAARAGQERLSAKLDVRPEQTRWRIDLRHKGKLDLSWLIEAENEHPLSTVPLSVDLHLNSVGDSFQGLLDSADGQLELVLGAGQLARSASRLPLGGVLFTLLDVLNPLDLRKQAASLRCAVFDFDIADGIGTSKRGLAVQTTGLNVLGGGAVNLRTSEIELHFKTAKRKGVGLNLLGIADKFVYVTGTLQHPHAAFDPKELLLYGGAAWASGGLSLVYDQIIQRLSGLGNPCDQVMRHGGRQ